MVEYRIVPCVSPEILKGIPLQRQTQASTTDQLFALVAVANRLGLYDAEDFLREHIKWESEMNSLGEHEKEVVMKNVHHGRTKGRKHIIYAQLCDKATGDLVISATLEYVLKVIKFRDYRLVD